MGLYQSYPLRIRTLFKNLVSRVPLSSFDSIFAIYNSVVPPD